MEFVHGGKNEVILLTFKLLFVIELESVLEYLFRKLKYWLSVRVECTPKKQLELWLNWVCWYVEEINGFSDQYEYGLMIVLATKSCWLEDMEDSFLNDPKEPLVFHQRTKSANQLLFL